MPMVTLYSSFVYKPVPVSVISNDKADVRQEAENTLHTENEEVKRTLSVIETVHVLFSDDTLRKGLGSFE